MAQLLIVDPSDPNALLVLSALGLTQAQADARYLKLAADNDPLTGVLSTIGLQPVATLTSDVGTTSLRYNNLIAGRLNAVTGTPTSLTTSGNYMLAAHINGAGTSNLTITPTGPFGIVAFIGSLRTNAGATSAVTITGRGHLVGGHVENITGAGTASVTAAGTGNFVHSATTGSGTTATGASDEGNFLQGRVLNGALLSDDAYGCFVQGWAVSTGAGPGVIGAGVGGLIFYGGMFVQGASLDGTLQGGADGVFVQGYALEACTISATASGAFARGFAADGDILASAVGSAAFGITDAGFDITASGRGSLACGDATAAITASASNSMQLGPGVNNEADTLKIGTAGLRLKGTTGAPGTAVNGDVYMGGAGNAFVTIHSNAKAVQINTGAAGWTTGAHATLRDFTGTTTAAQALQLLETLIEELKAANLIN